MTMPYDPYLDPYISPPQITPPGSMGTPLGGAARAQPNIPRSNWEKLAAALIIAGALRGGKPRPLHQLAAGYLGGMGQKRQTAHGEWREDEAKREAEAQRMRQYYLATQGEQKRDVREEGRARARLVEGREYEASERERERGELGGILGNLPPGMEGIGTIAQLGARGINLAAGPQGRLMGPEPMTPEQQAKEEAIKALEAKGDPTSMALATAARLGWTPPTSIQEMGAGLPVAQEREADLAGTLATTARTEGLTKGEAAMLPLEMESERALSGQRRASAAASGRSGRGGGEKEETARTRGLRLSTLRNDRARTVAQLEGGVAMIEDFATGEKRPVQYDKVTNPQIRADLREDYSNITAEIKAMTTGTLGTPLTEVGGQGWGNNFRVIEQKFGKDVAEVLRGGRKGGMSDYAIAQDVINDPAAPAELRQFMQSLNIQQKVKSK